MSAKHTPGPWGAGNIGFQGWTVTADADDTVIAIVGGGNNGEDPSPTYEADARLIAAAPDMLAALRMFKLTEEMIVGGQGDVMILRIPISTIEQAAAALVKAGDK